MKENWGRNMIAISEEEFLQKNLLHISNIEEGFEKYEYMILSGTEEAYRDFIECAVSINGEEHSYFDFYYSRLQEEEKKKVKESLSLDEQKKIDDLGLVTGIYYPLQGKWIPLAAKITAKEKLFSTFYFEKYPCTLWGNYSLRYPIFFKNREIRKIYENAASACGLFMEG